MRNRSLAIVVAATAILWVVPSVGTQGMGTIGQRVVHADASVFDTRPESHATASAMLARGDRAAEDALGL